MFFSSAYPVVATTQISPSPSPSLVLSVAACCCLSFSEALVKHQHQPFAASQLPPAHLRDAITAACSLFLGIGAQLGFRVSTSWGLFWASVLRRRPPPTPPSPSPLSSSPPPPPTSLPLFRSSWVSRVKGFRWGKRESREGDGRDRGSGLGFGPRKWEAPLKLVLLVSFPFILLVSVIFLIYYFNQNIPTYMAIFNSWIAQFYIRSIIW